VELRATLQGCDCCANWHDCYGTVRVESNGVERLNALPLIARAMQGLCKVPLSALN
jgi:hypothetical protein